MSKVVHFTVEQPIKRLDLFLSTTLPDRSRSFWQKQCERGDVLVDDLLATTNQALKVGQRVTVLLPEQPDFSQNQLPVVYEDDDVLVINKPSGILTHAKGVISEEFTVAEFIRPRSTDGLDTNRPGIVHRLDRGTSGLLIAAKHTEAKRWLQKQFSERKVKKTYIALVQGHLTPSEAMLQLPIERNPKKPQQFRVGGNGRSAETAYKVMRFFQHYSLVELYPLTGRTHQLRVHMSYLHHPVVGDALYGATLSIAQRLFLHAGKLEITIPARERRVFEIPLPPELQTYVDNLHHDS
jgi:23S rRNA pseudouridine1911/1915/1917 synthase